MNNMGITITKKIAKQGRNLILIIPRNLHHLIRGGDLVEVRIDTLIAEEKNDRN